MPKRKIEQVDGPVADGAAKKLETASPSKLPVVTKGGEIDYRSFEWQLSDEMMALWVAPCQTYDGEPRISIQRQVKGYDGNIKHGVLKAITVKIDGCPTLYPEIQFPFTWSKPKFFSSAKAVLDHQLVFGEQFRPSWVTDSRAAKLRNLANRLMIAYRKIGDLIWNSKRQHMAQEMAEKHFAPMLQTMLNAKDEVVWEKARAAWMKSFKVFGVSEKERFKRHPQGLLQFVRTAHKGWIDNDPKNPIDISKKARFVHQNKVSDYKAEVLEEMMAAVTKADKTPLDLTYTYKEFERDANGRRLRLVNPQTGLVMKDPETGKDMIKPRRTYETTISKEPIKRGDGMGSTNYIRYTETPEKAPILQFGFYLNSLIRVWKNTATTVKRDNPDFDDINYGDADESSENLDGPVVADAKEPVSKMEAEETANAAPSAAATQPVSRSGSGESSSGAGDSTGEDDGDLS